MSESAVFSVIQSIGKLKLSEARFSHSIKEQLDKIESTLRRLQYISRVADVRQYEDERIRDWVAKTREAVYNAEDLLRIFAIEISSRMERSVLRRPSEKKLETLHDVESKISFRETEWQLCNIGSVDQGEIRQEKDFIGLEEDCDELVSRLVNVDGADCCHVVSIIGMAGIGKTALARRIYENGNVRRHFHAFAWVMISRYWQLEDVMQRVLYKLVPEKKEQISRMRNIPELIKELFEVQKTKKCLVVLDDICGTDVWDSLRLAFLNHKSGSKVLLTTRVKEIALRIDTDTTCYLYEQRHLNEEESWVLLQKKSLGENEYNSGYDSSGSFSSCNSVVEENESNDLDTAHSEDGIVDVTDMEKLGREMVEQCGGLPLPINLLGGILMTKSSFSEWEAVQQSFKSFLREKGIGENERVYEMLALSYHALPYQIKQCFWYLANFPPYYTVSAQKLYQLWAAEGFVLSDEEDESIMDIAEHYLTELEKNFMVQVQVEESTKHFKSCQLHDFVREICILKGNEENFRKTIHFSNESELDFSSSESTSTRSTEASIDVDSHFDIILISEQENVEQVRSALVYSKLSERERKRKNLQSTAKRLCDNYKLLRVFDLERFDFGDELCESIGNLVHLRYLSFRGSRFTKLPSSIGNLKFLQTLDLRVAFDACLIIPDELSKLNQLKHLYLPLSQNRTKKLQLSSLRYLEILKNFDPRFSDFKDIPKLNKLRKLTVIFCVEMEHVKAINKYLRVNPSRISDSSFRIHTKFISAKDLLLLEKVVGCVHLRKLDLVGEIEKLPEHYHFSQMLTKLTLRKSELKADPLNVLEKLLNLFSLALRNNACVGNTIRSSRRGFGQLRTIKFYKLDFLEDWIIEEGSMPNLMHITIEDCSKLKKLPGGLKYLGNIRKVMITNMPEAFKQKYESVEMAGCDILSKVTFIGTKQTSSCESKHQQGIGNDKDSPFVSIVPKLVPKEWQNPS